MTELSKKELKTENTSLKFQLKRMRYLYEQNSSELILLKSEKASYFNFGIIFGVLGCLCIIAILVLTSGLF